MRGRVHSSRRLASCTRLHGEAVLVHWDAVLNLRHALVGQIVRDVSLLSFPRTPSMVLRKGLRTIFACLFSAPFSVVILFNSISA